MWEFVYHISNKIKCVLPNAILKKCPSEHDDMCSSDNEVGVKLELKRNYSSHIRANSETYPYPKGEHN